MPIRLGGTDVRGRIRSCLVGWAAGWALGDLCRTADRSEGGLPLPVEPPAPCRDLSVQIALLPRIRELPEAEIDPQFLAEGWTKALRVAEGSYGFALRNLGWGLRAPVAGWFRNPSAADASAIGRSLLYACLAPAAPGYAASLAYADAVIDHSEDGALAAMLTAGLASVAYVEPDPLRLVTAAAGVLPPGCELLDCVTDLRRARRKSNTWVEAYQVIEEELGHLPPTHASAVAARIVLSLLYGGDWTAHVAYGADAGGDLRVSMAALAGILGALGEAPPAPYSDWVGDSPEPSPEVTWEENPSFDSLAEGLADLARDRLASTGLPAEIVLGETDLSEMDGAELTDPGWAQAALGRDLGEVSVGEGEQCLCLHYEGPPAVAAGGSKTLLLTAPGLSESEVAGTLRLTAAGALSVGPEQPQAASSGAYFLVSARGRTPEAVTALTATLSFEDGREVSAEFPLIAESCWWVCGPFEAAGAEPMRATREPERELSGVRTYEGRDKMRVRFRKLSFPDLVLDLEDWFQGIPGILYLVGDFDCEEALDARLVLPATGPLRVWLDGRMALRRDEGQEPIDFAGTEPTPVRLAAGHHRLLLKVMRGEAPLRFGLLFTDAEGRPLPTPHLRGWSALESE